jgi:diacylglycerol kinase family enzyme
MNGLVDTPAALAIVRAGTGNVLAKEVGVPRSPAAGLHVLVEGEDYVFDAGMAGSRYFLLMAGIGFDGAVVRRVPRALKRLLGTTAYVLVGVPELLRFPPRRVDLKFDGEPQALELYWLLLGNTRSYGGVLNVAHRALVDDGLLDAYAFSGGGRIWVPGVTASVLLGRHEHSKHVAYRQLRTVEIVTPGLPVQADGEYFGETPMSFAVRERAVRLRLPPGGADHLLTRAPSG